MALLPSNPTLLDLLHVMQPNGGIETNIVDRLAQRLPILEDAVAMEGNETTGHTFTAESSLPALGWRRFGEGVSSSKGTDEQFTETCAMLEGYSKVDCGLAELNGAAAAFRASQDRKFMTALKIEAANTLIYGNVKATPEKFHGFMPRFSSTTGPTGSQIVLLNAAPYGTTPTGITASGTDNATAMFVAWGEGRCYLIYPKGTIGGIRQKDLGEQVLEDSNGKINTWWMTHWKWNLGLCIEDQRQVSMVRNIDASALAANTNGAMTALIDALIDAYYKIFDETDSRIVLYTNRALAAALHKGAMLKASSQLTLDTYAGKKIPFFMNIPVRTLDSLGIAESTIT